MLTINIKEHEFYDGAKERFFYTKPYVARLEHSLISIAKWEEYWKKAYLPSRSAKGVSGYKEEQYYLKCMLINNDAPDHIPMILMDYHKEEISEYIADPHTATVIHRIRKDDSKSVPTITSEIIYYWMIKYNVPPEYAKWHLNRLLMLLDVCSVKEQDTSRMSPLESAKYRQALNNKRRGR